MKRDLEFELDSAFGAMRDFIVDLFCETEIEVTDEDMEIPSQGPTIEDEEKDEEYSCCLQHVVSVGYADDVDDVVVMSNENDREKIHAALLLAAAKIWPCDCDADVEYVNTLRSLANDARNMVEAGE